MGVSTSSLTESYDESFIQPDLRPFTSQSEKQKTSTLPSTKIKQVLLYPDFSRDENTGDYPHETPDRPVSRRPCRSRGLDADSEGPRSGLQRVTLETPAVKVLLFREDFIAREPLEHTEKKETLDETQQGNSQDPYTRRPRTPLLP